MPDPNDDNTPPLTPAQKAAATKAAKATEQKAEKPAAKAKGPVFTGPLLKRDPSRPYLDDRDAARARRLTPAAPAKTEEED